MKKIIIILLLLPLGTMAQKPARHYAFSSNDPSLFAGSESLSPSGNLLLATFYNFNQTFLYEILDLRDGKTVAKGRLDDKPFSIAWSYDEKLVAMSFIGKPPVCFEFNGKLTRKFTGKEDGTIAFNRNTSLKPGVKDSSFLYVFANDRTYKYTDKGVLTGNLEEPDGFFSSLYAWFHPLSRTYKLISDTEDELATYSPDGVKKGSVPLENISLVNGHKTDKDGSKFLCYSDNELAIYDAGTGKKTGTQKIPGIISCAFTPDSRNILVKTKDNIEMYGADGKKISSMPMSEFYSEVYYTAFGSELACINSSGVDIYSCRNYFPVAAAEPKPVLKNDPIPPVVKENKLPTLPVPKENKWTLPYTAADFIVPLQKDSFYLYSTDAKARYYISYKKDAGSVLWKNPYAYYQYFGFSDNAKFSQLTMYILDVADAEAKIGSYAMSGTIEKQQMIGGNNFLARIPALAGKGLSWTMKVYDQVYDLSSQVIDNVYKGKKGKCLTVTRTNMVNGKAANEVYYYQQGLGLVKIEAGGQVAFQR